MPAGLVAGVCALAFGAIALSSSWRIPAVGDLVLDTDFYGDLVLAAQHVARGQFSVQDYPYKGPLYSFVLAAAHGLVGDWYRAATLVAAVAAAAALLAIYRAVRPVFGPAVGLATMAASALVPEFFVQATHATTDLLFLALAMASVALFCSTAPVWRRRGLAGAVAALAFLTRYNGGVLLVAGLLADFLVIREERARRRVHAAAWFAAGFLVVATPWFAVNLAASGHLLPGRNAQNVVAGLYGDARWAQVHAEDAGSLLDVVREAPGRAVVQVGRNLVSHAALDLQRLLGWPMALVALLGAAGLLLRPPTDGMRRFLCFPVLYFIAMGAVFYAPRFSFFLLPAYLATGFGFVAGLPVRPPAGWARRLMGDGGALSRRPRVLLPALVAGCAAFAVPRIVAGERAIRARQPLDLLPAAAALEAHARGETAPGSTRLPLVMARKGHLAFLAHLPYQPYPKAAARTLDALLGFARERGVRYVAYGGPEFELCPDLRFMAVADSIPGLGLVYETSGMRVYELRANSAPVPLSDTDELAMLEANVRMATERSDAPDVLVRALGDLARFQEAHRAPAAAEAALRRIIGISDAATTRRDVAERNGAIGRYKLAKLLLQEGRAAEAAPLADASARYFDGQGPRATAARAYLLAARCQDALGHADEGGRLQVRARTLDPQAGSEPASE